MWHLTWVCVCRSRKWVRLPIKQEWFPNETEVALRVGVRLKLIFLLYDVGGSDAQKASKAPHSLATLPFNVEYKAFKVPGVTRPRSDPDSTALEIDALPTVLSGSLTPSKDRILSLHHSAYHDFYTTSRQGVIMQWIFHAQVHVFSNSTLSVLMFPLIASVMTKSRKPNSLFPGRVFPGRESYNLEASLAHTAITFTELKSNKQTMGLTPTTKQNTSLKLMTNTP